MSPVDSWEERAAADPWHATRPRWARPLGPATGLLWLAFPIVTLLQAHPSPAHLVLGLIGGVAFAVLFVSLRWRPQPRLRPDAIWLATLTALAWLLTIAERPGWGMLFVFVAIGAVMRLPPRLGAPAILVCSASAALATALGGGTSDDVVSWTAVTLGLGILMFGVARLIDANAALRQARAALAERAVAEERLRFARDLHDLLGHSLSVIALKAELAGRLLPADPQRAAGEIGDLERVAREALAEVRQAVSGYRRPTLAGELAGARAALEAAGIRARIEPQDGRLPAAPEPDAEAVLAWAVREGTTNVIRHSGARSARIAVTGTSAEIADDGMGGAAAANGGHGLAGLRERAERAGGEVEAGPVPGGGFRLRVRVPG